MSELIGDNMRALLGKAERGLAALPAFDHRNRAPYDAAVAQLVAQLKAGGARIDNRPAWETARMAYGGVRSTCTQGTAGAIRNWCEAVRKRLGEPS